MRRPLRKATFDFLYTSPVLVGITKWYQRRWLDRIGAPDPDAVMEHWFARPPQPGEAAPDFTLKRRDGAGAVALSHVLHERPVVLIFGSFT